jgi:hypothetical protein
MRSENCSGCYEWEYLQHGELIYETNSNCFYVQNCVSSNPLYFHQIPLRSELCNLSSGLREILVSFRTNPS